MADYPNFAGEAQFKDTASVPTPPANNLAVYSDGGVLKTKNSSGAVKSVSADMVGATSSTAGTAGLVPAPAAGDNEGFLCGDASFKRDFQFPAPKAYTLGTGRYYLPPFLVGRPEVGTTPNINKTIGAIFVPFFIRGPATISSISFITNTANWNTDLVVGVYSADFSTGHPLTKIAQADTVNLSSTATNVAVTTNITAAVQGMYWCVLYVKTTVSGNVKAASVNNDGLPYLNMITGAENIAQLQRRLLVIKDSSISSGILPATLTSSDIENTTNNGNSPSLWIAY